jgi:uncharacterized protein
MPSGALERLMPSNRKAYLDVETDYTGKFPDGDQRMFRDYGSHKITVLGLRILDGKTDRLIQWVGEEVSRQVLLDALAGIKMLITYNGRSIPDGKGRMGFDFPVIAAQLGTTLDRMFPHTDLVLSCWRRGLYGGLKKVEEVLGLKRSIPGKDGRWAMMTWRKYCQGRDPRDLEELLAYNREDVMMLEKLERALRRR